MTNQQNLPQIVNGSGTPSPIVGPEMEKVVSLVSQISQTAQLVRIRKAVERKYTQGRKLTILRDVTDTLQVIDVYTDTAPSSSPYIPKIPWATMQFLNMGPGPVEFSINDTMDYTQAWINTPMDLDYTEADERIHLVTFKAYPGQTAKIQIVATY